MEGGGEALAMLKGQLVQLGLGVKVVKWTAQWGNGVYSLIVKGPIIRWVTIEQVFGQQIGDGNSQISDGE